MAASQSGRDKVEKLIRRALFDRNWDEAESVIGQIPEGKLLPNIHVDKKERWSVLHVAAINNAPTHVVQRILDVVDVEFCMQRDANGNNPLHRLCRMPCDIESVRLLALAHPRAFYEMNKEEGTTPAFQIFLRIPNLWSSLEQIAQLLAEVATAFPDGMYSVNKRGENLLHQAIRYCSMRFTLVGAILELAPELMGKTDKNGQTPVHFAARRKKMKTTTPALMKFLVNGGGCCALGLVDDSGRTPLHIACANSGNTGLGHYVTRALIQILVRKYPGALDVEDDTGMTPLALFRRHYKRLCYRSREESIVEAAMTLMTGAPLRCSDSPSLHTLFRHEQCTLDLARFLVTALPDQALDQDGNGNLPLHVVSTMPGANDRYFVDVVERLLKVYPSACKITNHFGMLPLELMARSGKTWNHGMRLVFLEHPAAVPEFGSNSHAICRLLAVLGREQRLDTMFRLLQDAPDLLFTS